MAWIRVESIIKNEEDYGYKAIISTASVFLQSRHR